MQVLPENNAVENWRNTKKILPAVFYGCEGLSLTLRAEARLKVFHNFVSLSNTLHI
jgi:hypothetical protein